MRGIKPLIRSTASQHSSRNMLPAVTRFALNRLRITYNYGRFIYVTRALKQWDTHLLYLLSSWDINIRHFKTYFRRVPSPKRFGILYLGTLILLISTNISTTMAAAITKIMTMLMTDDNQQQQQQQESRSAENGGQIRGFLASVPVQTSATGPTIRHSDKIVNYPHA